MKTIVIPVSRLSKKILQKDLSDGIIDARSLLFFIINQGQGYDPYMLTKKEKLTETFDFKLTLNAAAKIKYSYKSGLVLHNYHRQQLLEALKTGLFLNNDVSKTINILFKHYNIEEDDYSKESLYRVWLYNMKNKARDEKKILDKANNVTLPYSVDEVLAFCNKFLKANPDLIYFKANTFNYERCSQVFCYYLHSKGQLTYTEIAKLTGQCYKTTTRQIYTFKNILEVESHILNFPN